VYATIKPRRCSTLSRPAADKEGLARGTGSGNYASEYSQAELLLISHGWGCVPCCPDRRPSGSWQDTAFPGQRGRCRLGAPDFLQGDFKTATGSWNQLLKDQTLRCLVLAAAPVVSAAEL